MTRPSLITRSVVLVTAVGWGMIGVVMMSKPGPWDLGEQALAAAIYVVPFIGALVFCFAPRRRHSR
jgi:hypothetical protein